MRVQAATLKSMLAGLVTGVTARFTALNGKKINGNNKKEKKKEKKHETSHPWLGVYH